MFMESNKAVANGSRGVAEAVAEHLRIVSLE